MYLGMERKRKIAEQGCREVSGLVRGILTLPHPSPHTKTLPKG
jgi:hypothetical protein